MSVLYLTENDVRDLVSISEAIEVVEQAFVNLAGNQAQNMPRQRLRTDQVMLHVLAGADRMQSQLGWKIYTTTKHGAKFLVGIYDGETGELLALIEADFLGQLRTAAASGVATRHLARPEASTLGLIGGGVQARTQAWAICSVREIRSIQVFSRNPERRSAFANQLAADLNLPVTTADTATEVVRHSDILVTATTSQTPVFAGEDLSEGVHINAVGSNFLKKTELDLETFRRVTCVTCDSREQCQLEAGDFVAPLDSGLLTWDNIHELADVVTGKIKREQPQQLTLFKSVGLGLQDVALGTLILKKAQAQQ